MGNFVIVLLCIVGILIASLMMTVAILNSKMPLFLRVVLFLLCAIFAIKLYIVAAESASSLRVARLVQEAEAQNYLVSDFKEIRSWESN